MVTSQIPPSHEEYYAHLVDVLEHGTERVPETWMNGLHVILGRGSLRVAHDLGLDPFLDDFLALQILRTTQQALLAD